jgi:hypothetical protein
MGYTPRQIAVRAQETASRMLSTLDRERIVVNFVEAYVREHNRFGIRAQAEYSREFMETIRRECLLEMVTHLDSELPRRLGFLARHPAKPAARGSKKAGKNTGKVAAARKAVAAQAAAKLARQQVAERQILELFRQEFYVALGTALRWEQEDLDAFWRDRELYESLKPVEQKKTGRGKFAAPPSGPFADRCGFLLDPSLLEFARRAAAKFRTELHTVASAVLAAAFVRRRDN